VKTFCGECDAVLRGWGGDGEKACGDGVGMGTKLAGMGWGWGRLTFCGAGMGTRLSPRVTLYCITAL